jgi:hypothetical protein
MDIMDSKWKYGLWGVALGAVLCAIVGLKWGGWETKSSAQALAQQQVNAALVKALMPICMTNFQTAANAPTKLGELKKIGTSWARESFIREGKWAEIGKEQVTSVVDACADALYKL